MRRSQYEIMTHILAFCTRARRKTSIMYENNLGYGQLKGYLSLLTSRHLLAHNQDMYVTTEKGHCFLEVFAQLKELVEEDMFKGLSWRVANRTPHSPQNLKNNLLFH